MSLAFPPPYRDFFLGLDLGQAADFTALAIVERVGEALKDQTFDVVQLYRFSLGTSYVAIADSVSEIAGRPELRPLRLVPPLQPSSPPEIQSAPDPTLCVDATGVGRAVVNLIMER